MVLTTFYFQLHQPFRLHPDRDKFLWDEKNREIFNQIANKCYIPATLMFTEMIKEYPNFKITLGMSGTFLKQAEQYRPEIIKFLQDLYDAGKEGRVEFLDETYYHSLTSLFTDPEKKEFRDQVSLHRQKMQDIFGVSPTSFRNTELAYNNEIAEIVSEMGYKAILCEKREDMFATKDGQAISPNAVFRARGKEKNLDLIVLPRNRELSDDITHRFTSLKINPEQYAQNIANISGEAVLLGYDYGHLIERLWADEGIFDFWINLPKELAKHDNIITANPSEVVERFSKTECPIVDIPGFSTSSWADAKRDILWLVGGKAQYALFKDIEILEKDAKLAGGGLLEKWRHLTSSDNMDFLHEASEDEKDERFYPSPYDGSVAAAAHILTRKISDLESALKTFYIHKKASQTPVIIISPETAKLPTEGMGDFAQYVSGKSGGMGEVVSALCSGLVDRQIPVHFITLNLRERFKEEAGMSEEEWIESRHKLKSQNIHLISSSLFANLKNAYDQNPLETAAEFQKQIINSQLKEIRSEYGGRGILHTHDWMAGGAIVAYAKLRGIPTLHTIHNTHTGYLPIEMLRGIGLERMNEHLYECWDRGQKCIDSHATAIKSATKISYVGKRFLYEVINDHFIKQWVIPQSVRNESKIKYKNDSAIVIPNGISDSFYPENQIENPDENMPGLAKKYSLDDNIIEAKKVNLLKFQKKTGLIQNPEAILLYWPSRLDSFQKGINLLEEIAQKFVDANSDVQIAIVGDASGADYPHREIMGRIACASKGKIAYQPFNEDLSILGYAAASDVFGASLYEPFGQIDAVGNLFGATATNRDTGGYHDKIKNLALRAWGAPQDVGNGVLFKDYNAGGLWWGLSETVKNHRYFRNNPLGWEKQMKRMMKEAREKYSLENMVAGYITAYEELNGKSPLV
jgi:glycogen synthase